jgi:hypothetical protein
MQNLANQHCDADNRPEKTNRSNRTGTAQGSLIADETLSGLLRHTIQERVSIL